MKFRKSLSIVALGAVVLLPGMALAQLPNDEFFGDQWYLERVSAPGAWDVTTGDRQVIIAVLDTGIDLDHPELINNFWVNTGEIAGNNLDDDRNGYVDDVTGWDFVNDDNEPAPDVSGPTGTSARTSALSLSHGTLVAGIIGAEANNARGYAGMMWDVQIMPVRMLDETGAGTEADAGMAIDYAVKNGARVINMSFAGDDAGPAFEDAIKRAHEAGVVIVAALGNSGRDVNNKPVYPACLRGEVEDWVIGVSATDELDQGAHFTNYGSSCADLGAPGEGIFGLSYYDELEGFDEEYGGPWAGTSAASPIVSGAAGLILSKYPALSPEQVRTALKLSVDPIIGPTSSRGYFGVGRLNIYRALTLAASMTGTVAAEIDSKPEANTEESGGTKFTEGAHYSFVALGGAKGAPPRVEVYRADGTSYASFDAYAPSFLGGINVAVEDMDGSGVPEIITGPGEGGGPHVRIFTAFGAVIDDFFAYDSASRKGVSVAVGDVTGDGADDIVTAVGAGVSNDVVVWDQRGNEQSRFTVVGFAPGTPFTLTVADVDDDWEKEIIIGPKSGEPRVVIYNHDGTRLVDFLAYASTMTAGLSLAAGDFDGDERDEIVVGPGTPGSAHVRIFNKIGALYGQFFAADQALRLGAKVAVTDINVDGTEDIVVIPAGGKGDVKVFSSKGEILSTIGSSIVSGGSSLGAW